MLDMPLLFFITIAIGIGWLLGRYDRKKHTQSPYVSMDMLSADRQSETMQAILNLAQRQEAVDLQLNLGSFYRRRGEIDKAISIHQSLFARPDLDKSLSAQVQFELAADYLNAGLYDRAERLLIELLKGNNALKTNVINKLITLYEEEQEWEKILNLANETKFIKNNKPIAYACCELAQQAIAKRSWSAASAYIKQALKWDSKCVRAMLLEANIAMEEGFPNKVVANIKAALNCDPGIVQLILPELNTLYESRHRPQEMEKLLLQLWYDAPSPLSLHNYVRHLSQHDANEDAIEQLTCSLSQVPTLQGVVLLLEALIEKGEVLSVSSLQEFKDILLQINGVDEGYHCQHCGIETDQHYWRCPSCKSWEAFSPNMQTAHIMKKNTDARSKHA